jgi:hypothetical protein
MIAEIDVRADWEQISNTIEIAWKKKREDLGLKVKSGKPNSFEPAKESLELFVHWVNGTKKDDSQIAAVYKRHGNSCDEQIAADRFRKLTSRFQRFVDPLNATKSMLSLLRD